METQKFTFGAQTRIEFGKGTMARAGEEAEAFGAQRAMVVTDKGVREAGLVERVAESLKREGIPHVVYEDISPNPRDYEMDRAGAFAREEGVDLLVAVGGGSVLDSAKVIGTLLTHGGSALDWCGIFKLKREITPLIAIPTTAGTGSEVTPFAVMTNTARRIKESIWDTKASARVALLDSDVLLGLPAHIMAATGIDALTHAIEAYTCKEATPYTDLFALYAIKLISKNLRRAVHDHDENACRAMMIGSNAAGLAFGFSDVAAVHCMAEALGGRYDIPHGVANAMLLPTVCEFNLSANYTRYARIAEMMGVADGAASQQAAEAGVEEIRRLCEDVGIQRMKEFTIIEPQDFHALARAAQENTSTPSNPIAMTEELYLQLYRKAYK